MNNTKKHLKQIEKLYDMYNIPNELRYTLKISGISKFNYGISGIKQQLFYMNFENGTKCIIYLNDGEFRSDVLEISYLSNNVLHREDYLASYIKVYRNFTTNIIHIHEITYNINGTLIEYSELELLKRRHTILKKLKAEV